MVFSLIKVNINVNVKHPLEHLTSSHFHFNRIFIHTTYTFKLLHGTIFNATLVALKLAKTTQHDSP